MSSKTTRKRKQSLPSADESSKHITRGTKPPLHSISFNRFIYLLALLSVLLAGYYCYRIVRLERSVGGWWNFALGKRPPLPFTQNQAIPPVGAGRRSTGDTVERKIKELAAALGMPSKDLASAIAAAVREHVPPASLSSIASKETGEAVRQLFAQDDGGKGGGDSFRGFGSVVGSIIGYDEPPDLV